MTLDLTDFQDLAKPVTFEIIFHALQQQTTTIFIHFQPLCLVIVCQQSLRSISRNSKSLFLYLVTLLSYSISLVKVPFAEISSSLLSLSFFGTLCQLLNAFHNLFQPSRDIISSRQRKNCCKIGFEIVFKLGLGVSKLWSGPSAQN